MFYCVYILILLIILFIYFQQNAAICDEISQTQEKLLIVREECKFLTKKLNVFEHKFGN